MPERPGDDRLRRYIFPEFKVSGTVELPPIAQLPLTASTVDSFPRDLHFALHDDYLPQLSKRFSESSHNQPDRTTVQDGMTLLALYFTIYPRYHALIGLHALEVAKLAWNIPVAFDRPIEKIELQTISSLLRISKSILSISLGKGVGEDFNPWTEIAALEHLLTTENLHSST
ncbi:hypothetical protein FRB99_007171 [Tulasnella sp. 403]|nr:hypothetical protein FRB99_007171 [Tulasnella sp. 403]